jgi:spermidine synthase
MSHSPGCPVRTSSERMNHTSPTRSGPPQKSTVGSSGARATPEDAPDPVGRLLPALLGLFFISGACGLIYQVLWVRLLAVVFGVTVHAASTVLASFMAGLALGSWGGGTLGDRTRHPLRLFGFAEILIGLVALATPLLLDRLTALYVWIASDTMGATASVLTAVRFVCAFGVLLVPTSLMGATLPLVLRSALRHERGLGSRMGLMYATNTAGAVVGAVAAGFYLIGEIGIQASFALTATLNVLVGLAALVLSRPLTLVPRGALGVESLLRGTSGGLPVRRVVFAVFAVTGFVALALEIVWFRLLVLYLPATTYAFTTMLATVLAGIAAGSYVAAPLLARERRWPQVLGTLQVGVALAALLSAAVLSLTYQAGWRTTGMIQASVVAILPATLLMGLSFPIGLRIWTVTAHSPRTAARIGSLYAVNLVGGIAGAVTAGFVLIPAMGLRASLILLAGLSLAAGLILWLAEWRTRPGWPLLRALVATSLVVAAGVSVPDPFTAALARRHPAGERLFWRDEGVQNTVSVHVRPLGMRILYMDGLHQASDAPEMVRLHRQIGHLAMALHPAPRRALVIGLGGGVTPGAVAQHAGTDVDIVELSMSVVRAASWFRHVNDEVLARPNVRLRVDDGRNYLLLNRAPYDVITADIIQPEHAGAGLLYSREYYELVRRALESGGLVLQWIGHRGEAHYRAIMRTFLEAFPYTTLWGEGQLMVGSTRPLRVDRAAFERKLEEPGTRAALEAIDITSFEALLALYVAGPHELRQFAGTGPVLTDDRPLIEYHRSLPPGPPVDLSGLRGDVRLLLSD